MRDQMPVVPGLPRIRRTSISDYIRGTAIILAGVAGIGAVIIGGYAEGRFDAQQRRTWERNEASVAACVTSGGHPEYTTSRGRVVAYLGCAPVAR